MTQLMVLSRGIKGRVWAVTLRHLRQIYKDPCQFIDRFFFGMFRVALWGFMGVWLQKDYLHDPQMQLAMMIAVISWEVVVRASFDMMSRLLDDINDKNIVNFFMSPLGFFEFIGGLILLAIINQLCMLALSAIVAYVCCHVNILQAPVMVIPFLLSAFVTGLSIGLLGSSLLIYTGRKFFGAIMMLAHMLAPVSGTYYPITFLPTILQWLATLVPIAYVTQGLRQAVTTATFNMQFFVISILLSSIYFTAAFCLYLHMFTRSKKCGLMRLHD